MHNRGTQALRSADSQQLRADVDNALVLSLRSDHRLLPVGDVAITTDDAVGAVAGAGGSAVASDHHQQLLQQQLQSTQHSVAVLEARHRLEDALAELHAARETSARLADQHEEDGAEQQRLHQELDTAKAIVARLGDDLGP
jgi:hypothetical protein